MIALRSASATGSSWISTSPIATSLSTNRRRRNFSKSMLAADMRLLRVSRRDDSRGRGRRAGGGSLRQSGGGTVDRGLGGAHAGEAAEQQRRREEQLHLG